MFLCACFVFGVVGVTKCVFTKAVGMKAGAEVPWHQKGMVSSVQFSLPARCCAFISRKNYELQMIQQKRKLVYAVQSEGVWRGKSPNLGEILCVISLWLDPDDCRKGKK